MLMLLAMLLVLVLDRLLNQQNPNLDHEGQNLAYENKNPDRALEQDLAHDPEHKNPYHEHYTLYHERYTLYLAYEGQNDYHQHQDLDH